MEITFGQAALVMGIVIYSLAIPGDFKYKLDGMGFGVCHQIHSHSFTIGGHQMPLCARCTGMYLGVLATLLLLATLRRRASRLPVRGIMAALAVFFGAMAFDGLNSTLQTFGSGLWDTTNLIRIVTGGLSGISMAAIFYPVFNISLWHRDATSRERVLEQPFELVGYVVAAGILVALVLVGGDWLYYPLAIVSVAGMLSLLTMATTMLVLIFTRREGLALTFSEVLTPLLLGLFMGLVLLTLIAWGRAALAPILANQAGMPLVPGLP
ncbi:MAG TPA: DUF2085 domain-containing protein [Chloroflexia bacterium]